MNSIAFPAFGSDVINFSGAGQSIERIESLISKGRELTADDQITSNIPFENLDILILEDSKFNQKVMEKCLKNFGCQKITMVPNGKEGVEILKTRKFDLIITDLNMPILDGFQVVETILAENLSVAPIIAWSSNESNEDEVHCQELGMVFMKKKVRPELLRKTIISCLNKTANSFLKLNPSE